MLPPTKLLVIDHNTDSGTLLVRTLARKFPSAMVQLCGDVGTATGAVATEKFDAVVLHRTQELTGVELIQTIRALDSCVYIVAVSGIDRSKESLAAGANAFMNYETWLNIGTVVRDVIAAGAEFTGAPTDGVRPPRGVGIVPSVTGDRSN